MISLAKIVYNPVTFTFQSGDIQIDRAVSPRLRFWLFTFQSGDIRMCTVWKHARLIRMRFTFQSGDIRIIVIRLKSFDKNVIYIPIWWYSNVVSLRVVATALLDLHSNLVIFKFNTSNILTTMKSVFTFQSGDIQIKIPITPKLPQYSFTFQSGDIQIKMRL